MLISNVLTGYLRLFVRQLVMQETSDSRIKAYLKSKLSSTVGCNIPKTPITFSMPPIFKCIAAA